MCVRETERQRERGRGWVGGHAAWLVGALTSQWEGGVRADSEKVGVRVSTRNPHPGATLQREVLTDPSNPDLEGLVTCWSGAKGLVTCWSGVTTPRGCQLACI